MDLEQAEARLKENGYSEVEIHEDPPGFYYSMHTHPVDTGYIVVSGQMTVWFEDRERAIKAGDYITIGKNIEHWAKMGEEGCKFLIGVRI